MLQSGMYYSELKDSYIIFICTFSVFDGEKHKYTFREYCEENFGIRLNDGTAKVFLSTKGKVNDVSKPLQAFLDYVDGNKPGDELMREIDNEVAVAKNREEWRREYMTMEMEILRRERAAKAEGMTEGMMKMALESVRNLIKRKNMSPEEAIDFLGYDATLSAKLLPLLA